MGLREDSALARDNPPQASTAGVRRAAPYAARTRDYYRSLSATSVGIELSVSVLIGLFFGRWLDGRIGTDPWMMTLFLCLGFTAGMRSIYRFVRQADRDAARSEAEAAVTGGASPP
jgi:F0F1-type ATP synthase assembly protein I